MNAIAGKEGTRVLKVYIFLKTHYYKSVLSVFEKKGCVWSIATLIVL